MADSFLWGGEPQEQDLKQIFEPFGPVDFVTMQKDATGRSLGQAYVQCAICTPLLLPWPLLSISFNLSFKDACCPSLLGAGPASGAQVR